jgi:hypothetical protein
VESGIASGKTIATKYVNDTDPRQGVKMTRPLCPYSQLRPIELIESVSFYIAFSRPVQVLADVSRSLAQLSFK